MLLLIDVANATEELGKKVSVICMSTVFFLAVSEATSIKVKAKARVEVRVKGKVRVKVKV